MTSQPNDLLAADEAQLENKTQETLAKWWCILNQWEWPNDLPNPEDPPKNVKDETPRRSAIMRKIEKMTPHKLRSYIWNKERMSAKEHEEWFVKTFGK